MMVNDRKFAIIDKRIDKIADEYYKKIIYPKQRLIDSEVVATNRLRTAVGLDSKRSLLQLPMTNERSDAIFKTLQT